MLQCEQNIDLQPHRSAMTCPGAGGSRGSGKVTLSCVQLQRPRWVDLDTWALRWLHGTEMSQKSAPRFPRRCSHPL